MKLNQLLSYIFFLLAFTAGSSCQKLDRPGMHDFKNDPDNPGGILKFYTAFDKTEVDSIKANFGTAVNATYVDGVLGKAYKGASNAYINYPSANDFANATSFTIAFWMKQTPHDNGAEFIFALPTTANEDLRSEVFFLVENKGQSTPELMTGKFFLQDQWFVFGGDQRLKNILNDQWHHLAFTYDEATSKLGTFVDGVALTGLPPGLTDVKKGGAPRGKLSFDKVSGFIIGGPASLALNKPYDSWQTNYTGSLDQFRIYNKVLSAAEIAALYNNKQ
ncbi:LamG domain-containing protein [Pseudoflavitalea sp. G-6-1-2]|uniref:LamG domain-containing protein n=1 Tax=Pseudoflavitalea sp. G-6-1-2 TaxID=2728841 RepID=UPI001469F2EE|nr:LamG domain-containing protein [Pseudoflavitalea sp. G-6-1-2]NML20129.1 LamG domain-containing protein [Pseudoflavitalea sp. G-6-1-2]